MQVLRFIFAVFALLGAADKILGNRLGLGEEFEKGILTAGTLSLAMVGMVCIAPALAALCAPACGWLAGVLGIDPAFLGGFIANDMGGASVAKALAADALLGGYHGLVVASMLGVTVSFTVPVALSMIPAPCHKEVLSGILCGVATLPLGCVAGGLVLGLPFGMLLRELIPVLLVAGVTCAGLVWKPALCRRIFAGIGAVVAAVITAGLGAAVFEYLTGKILIPGMAPLSEAFAVVTDIAVILSGVFPLVAAVARVGRKLFSRIGKALGICDEAVLGLVSSLANSIPTFHRAEQMDPRGRTMNLAFAVSAAFVFGDHLAFTMAFDESFLPAVVVGKLVSGAAALLAAHFMARPSKNTAPPAA
jgi:ethanolamine transporter